MDDDHLAHLPERKRRELRHAVRILFEEFEDAQKGKLSDKARRGRILKLILFGSYARGDWIEDRASGYLSDYDLLVVVNDDRFADQHDAWERAGERFAQELSLGGRLATPVNVVVHTYADVNDQLARGRPFFVDIARDGLMLHEASGFPLTVPEPLSEAQKRTEAARYFEQWFPRAAHRFELAREAIRRGYDKEAAFDLHQATERLYHCVLLVLTLYSPKLHRLSRLRPLAEGVEARLIPAWPRDTRFARRCFARLDRAYVDARYSPRYAITDEELAWLVERVTVLTETVTAICAERLADPDSSVTKA